MGRPALVILSVLICIPQTAAYGSRFQPSNVYIRSYCGPNCLTVFLMMNGIPVSLDDVARIAGRRQNGASMLGLKIAAEAHGVCARGVRLKSLKSLGEVGYPAIVLLKSEDQGQPGHYVLVTGITRDRVKIVDPPRRPYLATLSSIEARIDGRALLLSVEPIAISTRAPVHQYVGRAIMVVSLMLFVLWLTRKIARPRTTQRYDSSTR